MKLKSLILGGVTALLGTVSGFAQNVEINFTGSTAFRSAAHATILDVLGGQGTAEYCYDGSTYGGSSHAVIRGQFNGKTYVVRTSWSGSTAGIASVVDQTTVNVIDETINVPTTAGAMIASPTFKAEVAQFSFSDVGVALSSRPTATLGGGPVGWFPSSSRQARPRRAPRHSIT